MPSPGSLGSVRFGVFEVDRSASKLLKGGRPVKLAPNPSRFSCYSWTVTDNRSAGRRFNATYGANPRSWILSAASTSPLTRSVRRCPMMRKGLGTSKPCRSWDTGLWQK